MNNQESPKNNDAQPNENEASQQEEVKIEAAEAPPAPGLLNNKMRDALQILGVLGIIAAVIGVWLQLAEFEENSLIRKATLISLYRTTLRDAHDLPRASYTDIGQVEALEGLSNLVSLQGIDISGLYFDGIELKGINLKNAKLKGTKISNGNLADCILDGASMEGAEFLKVNLKRASLKNIKAFDVRFEDVILDNADLRGADITDSWFDKVSMVSANLSRVLAQEANFHKIILKYANLSKIRFPEGWVWDSDLSYVNFEKARLYFAGFFFTDLRKTSFKNAKMWMVRFSGATSENGEKLDHEMTDLTGADFTNADITGVDFSYTKNLTQIQINKACYRHGAIKLVFKADKIPTNDNTRLVDIERTLQIDAPPPTTEYRIVESSDKFNTKPGAYGR